MLITKNCESQKLRIPENCESLWLTNIVNQENCEKLWITKNCESRKIVNHEIFRITKNFESQKLWIAKIENHRKLWIIVTYEYCESGKLWPTNIVNHEKMQVKKNCELQKDYWITNLEKFRMTKNCDSRKIVNLAKLWITESIYFLFR